MCMIKVIHVPVHELLSFCCNRIIMIKSSLANSLKEIKAINQIFIEKKMNKYLGFLTIRTL